MSGRCLPNCTRIEGGGSEVRPFNCWMDIVSSTEEPASIVLQTIGSVQECPAPEHVVKPLPFNLFTTLSFILFASPHELTDREIYPCIAAIPGNTFPSKYSNIAPPPVLT